MNIPALTFAHFLTNTALKKQTKLVNPVSCIHKNWKMYSEKGFKQQT